MKQGIFYMLFASFLFAFMGVFAKELANNGINSIEIVFFRNIFGVILISYSLYKTKPLLIGNKHLLLFFRGFIGFLALLMFFYNIANIPLAEAMTFSKTSPIWTAIFAYIFLKEKLSKKAIIGVLIGFIGILFITGFNINNIEKNDLIGILSGVGAALAYTSIRELKKIYDTRIIVLSFVLVGSIGPLILLYFSTFITTDTFDFLISPWQMPKGIDWVYIILLGIFSTYAQIFMTKAYSLAKAGIIGTISYSNIAWSVLFGYILYNSTLEQNTIIGIILIVISGILVSK